MTSENDDLVPTSMGDTKNEVSPEFKEATQEKNKDINQDIVEPEMTDMIREDAPHPVSRPDWDTYFVDAEHFDEQWVSEQEKYSPHNKSQQDIFDQIDQEQEWSERLGRHKGQEKE